eukprot:GDKJ01006939.1.p1 GENE.GDKJ01006939.1~~GDKJ01006939.1.p1  ORF type:complete len:676 (+),score=121.27 GDKJ01006939.1:29-2056(+)
MSNPFTTVPNHPPVPFLPGTSFHDPRKQAFHKNQTLVYKLDSRYDNMKPEDVSLDADLIDSMTKADYRTHSKPTGMTHFERQNLKESLKNTYRPAQEPAWLKHDNQVLRFYAYFQESIPETNGENYRVRNCIILFYLCDGTLQINEPRIENSGIPQGCFLKRHRVVNENTNNFVGISDFKLGLNIRLYSRAYKLVDCDDFTRWFFESQGKLGDLGSPVETHTDNFFENEVVRRAAFGATKLLPQAVVEAKEYAEIMHGGSRKNRGLKQHLENDRRVLRFNAYWDDKNRYGSRLYYTILYFLSDDTVQILEAPRADCGRDMFPVLLRRMPLRKNPVINAAPGMLEVVPEYYGAEDFVVGRDIRIYSRDIHLYDCDAFTRDFFRTWAGIEQGSEPIPNPPVEVPRLAYPPHTGLGVEEDSIQNVLHLIPQPPKLDTVKLFALSDTLLRFEAVMINGAPKLDDTRRFIIGVRPADDKIGCWELRQRNSGQPEGKFAEVGKKKHPIRSKLAEQAALHTLPWNAPPRSSADPYYRAADFYVGAVITINAAQFRLIRSDEFAAKFMETRGPQEFPVASMHVAARRVQPLMSHLAEKGDATINASSAYQSALSSGLDITEHEIIAICRGGEATCSKIGAVNPNASGDNAHGPTSLEEIQGYVLDIKKVLNLASATLPPPRCN